MTTILAGPAFHDLRKMLGDEAVLALMEAAGGTRIKVPKTAHVSSSLARTICLSALETLADAFGGGHIYVPLAKAFRANVLRTRGLSQSQVAVRLCVSEEAVRRYLLPKRKNARKASRKLVADVDHLTLQQKL